MKYVIAAVPYSDNLGDGVIADCLVDFINRKNANDVVSLCDISYRKEVTTFKNKDTKMGLFLRLPRFIRQLVVVLFFTYKYYRQGRGYLDEKLKDCDELLIGGGQLVSDVDLNFPLKLFFLIKYAEKYNIKTSIVSVGVASRWNWLSRSLMKRVLSSSVITKIAVRDEFSKKNLTDQFGLKNIEILPDPALMCSVFSKDKLGGLHKFSNKKVLGLGIADIEGLNYSSDIENNTNDNSIEYVCSIVEKTNANNYEVYLFTNGAAEDERFLHEYVIPMLKLKKVAFNVLPRCSSSTELVNFIKKLDLLVAYRLHANIIACSFNIPYFAVGWDNKVLSFFRLQDRESCVFNSLKEMSESFDMVINSSYMEPELSAESVEKKYSDFLGFNCEY